MPHIVIIDDQPHIRELISQELIDEGHDVVGVETTESLAACFQDSKPDLVLLDPYLNGHEGWELLEYIKGKYPELPVLIVTAYDNYRYDPRLSQADGHVIKSLFTFGRLKKKIEKILGENQFPKEIP